MSAFDRVVDALWGSFFVIVLLSSSPIRSALADNAAEEYEYVVSADTSFFIVPPSPQESEGYLRYVEHSRYIAEFCDPSSDFICVFGIQYAFAVPKVLAPHVDQWTFKDVEFRVKKRNSRVSIFGREYNDVLVIETPSSATPIGRETGASCFSLYSREHGLIGIQLPTNHAIYWSSRPAGFGAMGNKGV